MFSIAADNSSAKICGLGSWWSNCICFACLIDRIVRILQIDISKYEGESPNLVANNRYMTVGTSVGVAPTAINVSIVFDSAVGGANVDRRLVTARSANVK